MAVQKASLLLLRGADQRGRVIADAALPAVPRAARRKRRRLRRQRGSAREHVARLEKRCLVMASPDPGRAYSSAVMPRECGAFSSHRCEAMTIKALIAERRFVAGAAAMTAAHLNVYVAPDRNAHLLHTAAGSPFIFFDLAESALRPGVSLGQRTADERNPAVRR